MLKRIAGLLLRCSSRAAIWLAQLLLDLDTWLNSTQTWRAIRERPNHRP